ncbi:unnamed protein product [Closterium sp. Yama58-4]|nr:unnamed protein product [Closterium sp. Yama58-4]
MAYNGDERNPNHWWKIEELSPSALYFVGPCEFIRNRRSGRVLKHSHQQQPFTDSVKPGSPVATTSTNRNRASGSLLTTMTTPHAPQEPSLLTGISDNKNESSKGAAASQAAAVPVQEVKARDNEVSGEENQWLLAEVNKLEIFTLQSRQGGAFLEKTCGAEVRGSFGWVEASTCCQWVAIRADAVDDVAKAKVDDVAGSTPELFNLHRKYKALLLEAPKQSTPGLAPRDRAFEGGLELTDKGIDEERYSTTLLTVLLPWSYLCNRVTGMALAVDASGSEEAREFEGGSLQQQQWRAVSVGVVALAPAMSYFFLQNRASDQWELRDACGGFWAIKNRGSGKVLDNLFGISIHAYSEDELQYHNHWTITPAGTTGGKAHCEQEEESGDKWCKAVQGSGEGYASLALVVDRRGATCLNGTVGRRQLCVRRALRLWIMRGCLEQRWRAVKTEKGYHVLQNRASWLTLDHYSGRRISAYDNNFSNEYHKWQLKDIEGGVYVVLKKKKMGMVLDHYYWERLEAVGGDEKNKAQHWRVVPTTQMVREAWVPKLLLKSNLWLEI